MVLVASLTVHALAAFGLTLLPANIVAELESVVAFEFEVAPIPAAVIPTAVIPTAAPIEDIVPAEPVAPVLRERRDPTPTPVAQAPSPPPLAPEAAPVVQAAMAPPSLDEVFGEPSAAPPEVMGGGSGPGFASSPGGRPGGRAGGTGTGMGTGGGHAAPSGPSEADVRAARRAYVRALEALLRAQARYPREARRDGHQGRVELALRVGRDGSLLDVRVASSSGFDELDDAALEAARRLSPPAPPGIVPWGAAQEVRAPVLYVLR